MYPMMTHLANLPPVSSSDVESADIWLHVNLTAFTADQSFQWDADGTEIDPILTVCVEENSLSYSECLQIINEENISEIQSTQSLHFDLPDVFEDLSIRISCVDDDTHSDEWGNGDDVCDLSQEANRSEVSVHINRSFSSSVISFSGFEDDWDQEGAASFNATISVAHYGDSDSDGVSDYVDLCELTDSNAPVGMNGCSYQQLDWDNDSVQNGVDPCPSLHIDTCHSHFNFIESVKIGLSHNGVENRMDSSRLERDTRISPDGKWLAIKVRDFSSGGASGIRSGIHVFAISDFLNHSGNGDRYNNGGNDFLLADFTPVRTLEWLTNLNDMMFSTDSKTLVVSGDGMIYATSAPEFDEQWRITFDPRLDGSEADEHCLEDWSDQNFDRIVSFNSKSTLIGVKCGSKDQNHRWLIVDSNSGEILGNHTQYQYGGSGCHLKNEFTTHPSEVFHCSFEYSFFASSSVGTSWISPNAQLRFENQYNSTHRSLTIQSPNHGNKSLAFETDYYGIFDRVQPFDDNEGAILLFRKSCNSEINPCGSMYHLNLASGLLTSIPIDVGQDSVLRMPVSGSFLYLYQGGEFTLYERDADGDGLVGNFDLCPSKYGTLQGCPDSDEDGIEDSLDLCQDTPMGEFVNEYGCAEVQLDNDQDGVNNRDDLCSESLHVNVNVRGCTPQQADTDNDGVNDAYDFCPETKATDAADGYGCSPNQAGGEWNYRGTLTSGTFVLSESGRFAGRILNSTVFVYDYSNQYSVANEYNISHSGVLLDISDDGRKVIIGDKVVDLSNDVHLSFPGQGLEWTSSVKPSFVGNDFIIFHGESSDVSLLNLSSMESKVIGQNWRWDVVGNQLLLYKLQLFSSSSVSEFSRICLNAPSILFESLSISNCEDVPYASTPHMYVYADENGITLMEQGHIWEGGKNSLNGWRHYIPVVGDVYGDTAAQFSVQNMLVEDMGEVDPPKICGYSHAGQPIWKGGNLSIGSHVFYTGISTPFLGDQGGYVWNYLVYSNYNDVCLISLKVVTEGYTTTYLVSEISSTKQITAINMFQKVDYPVHPDLDSDNDGIPDLEDNCPNTETDSVVNSIGCSSKQYDTDNDGVFDFFDECTNTPVNENAGINGCSSSQIDTDNDGVMDDNDECPDSVIETVVDTNGCTYQQIDDDLDGVPNILDLCPSTIDSQTTDENGCGENQEPTQADSDNDGLVDVWDFCTDTPTGEVADLRGCSPSQLDDDGDGISNAADECPEFSDKDRLLSNGCEDTSLIYGLSPNAVLTIFLLSVLGIYLSLSYVRQQRSE
ncbi:thrombospondin type 3 repeat-containing protein [Candidatus Poseidoniales archaeon]|nr:thrombospondin type 3 repeat-containing protein [Candidatus Poseidoniales archaeon]